MVQKTSDCTDDHIRTIIRQILDVYDKDIQRRLDLKADGNVCTVKHEDLEAYMGVIKKMMWVVIGAQIGSVGLLLTMMGYVMHITGGR